MCVHVCSWVDRSVYLCSWVDMCVYMYEARLKGVYMCVAGW